MDAQSISLALRKGKTSTWLIVALLLAVVVFGLLSFFKMPIYEKGASACMTGLLAALSGSLGFKWGITMPGNGNDDAAATVTCPKCGNQFVPGSAGYATAGDGQ